MSHMPSGVAGGNFSTGFYGGHNGVPYSLTYTYRVAPAAAAANNLRVAALLAAGDIILTAGAGITLETDYLGKGVAAYVFDVPRTMQFVKANNPTTPTVVTISGYRYGQQVVEQLTLTAANGTQVSLKAMDAVVGMTSSASMVAGDVSIGTTNTFGLPYRVDNRSDIVVNWNGALDPGAIGTFTAADTTDPATATTGDVMGTYLTDAGDLADGNKVLNISMYMPLVDPTLNEGLTITDQKVFGVEQYATGWSI